MSGGAIVSLAICIIGAHVVHEKKARGAVSLAICFEVYIWKICLAHKTIYTLGKLKLSKPAI